MARPAISKRELLEYVRLEESEDVAERLKQSSFIYVGSVQKGGMTAHYWSYPSLTEIAWVTLSDDNGLATIESEDVPGEILARSVALADHPARPAQISNNPVDRSCISKPQWVPASCAPRLFFFPMYHLTYPFESAVVAFSAKSKREDLGIDFWHRYFCVKLTSGRYALLQAEEAKPDRVSIELEVEPHRGEYPHGFVHVSDLKEILSVLGAECDYPLVECQYQWRQ